MPMNPHDSTVVLRLRCLIAIRAMCVRYVVPWKQHNELINITFSACAVDRSHAQKCCKGLQLRPLLVHIHAGGVFTLSETMKGVRSAQAEDYNQIGQLSENIHRLLSEKECAIFDRGTEVLDSCRIFTMFHFRLGRLSQT